MEDENLKAAANRLIKGVQFREDATLCLFHFLDNWRNGEDHVIPVVAKWVELALIDAAATDESEEVAEALGLKKPPNREQDFDKSLQIGAFIELYLRHKNLIKKKTIVKPGTSAQDKALEYFDLSSRTAINYQLKKLTTEDERGLKTLINSELLALVFDIDPPSPLLPKESKFDNWFENNFEDWFRKFLN